MGVPVRATVQTCSSRMSRCRILLNERVFVGYGCFQTASRLHPPSHCHVRPLRESAQSELVARINKVEVTRRRKRRVFCGFSCRRLSKWEQPCGQRSMTRATKHHLENKEETQKQTHRGRKRCWFSLQQCQPDLTANSALAPGSSANRKLGYGARR